MLRLALLPSGVALAETESLEQQLTKIQTVIQDPKEAAHLPEVADSVSDGRAEAIERLLERYQAPIRGLGEKFVEVADRDGYDWRLLVAIAGIESGFGRAQLHYNLFGWGGGHIPF